jgi:hypothetical protein
MIIVTKRITKKFHQLIFDELSSTLFLYSLFKGGKDDCKFPCVYM